MGTVADSPTDGKAYGFCDAWSGPMLSCPAAGIDSFGIPLDSFYQNALMTERAFDGDDHFALRSVELCVETNERFDEHGALDGLDATLELPGGPIIIDEGYLCEANALLTAVCVKAFAPRPSTADIEYYQFEDELPFRDRIRARFNLTDDLRAKIIPTIEADVRDYFERVRGHAVHPALILWTARTIAFLLFSEHRDAYLEAEPPSPPNPEADALWGCLVEQDRLHDIGVPKELIDKREACWAACWPDRGGKFRDPALAAWDAAREECQRAYATHAQKRDKAIAPALVERRNACYAAHKAARIESGRWRTYLDALRACEDAYKKVTQRTEIMLSGRHTRDLVQDVLNVLLQGALYRRINRVARIVSLSDGVTTIEQLSDEWLRGYVHDHATIVKRIKTEDGWVQTPASMRLDIIKEARSYGLDQFRPIAGITASPLRLDGTLASKGYDPITQLYHVFPDLPQIPPQPTTEDIRLALALLHEVFGEFAFDDPGSRANTYAALVTIVARSMIRGSTPLFTVNARKQGSGKTFLVEVLAMAALGVRIGATSLTTHEEERRKLLLSVLMGSAPIILLDNVVGMLNSPALASAITAGIVTDRVLGRSEVISVPNTSVFFLNGNNVAFTGELTRRRVPIMLDAKLARPELRAFKRPDLLLWVEEHRAKILYSVCVLVRAWLAAGRPKGDHPRPASFGRWADLVGGVLHHAGIAGFLDNMKQTNPDDDLESTEWENLLSFLHTRTEGEPFTASFVHELVTDGGGLRKHDTVELLPVDLADLLAKFPQTFSKRLGIAFRDRHRTRFGVYRLEREGEDRNKRTLWKVVKDA